MSQRIELKPCPFCGGKVEIKQDMCNNGFKTWNANRTGIKNAWS